MVKLRPDVELSPPSPRQPEPKASKETEIGEPDVLMKMGGCDIIEKMGVSGMAIIAHSNQDFIDMFIFAFQSWFYQAIMFLGLWKFVSARIHPKDADDPGVELNALIFVEVVALVVHFANCFGEVPFALSVLMRITDIHDTPKEIIFAAPVFLVDSVVIPMIQLILGALFICSSPNAVSVLLNSCGVAFISQIDNWILSLSLSFRQYGGNVPMDELTVYIPCNVKVSKIMQTTVCVFPIMPFTFALFIIYWSHMLGLMDEADKAR